MSKKAHQKQLDRARAKRASDRIDRKQRRVRIIALVVIAGLALSLFAGAIIASSEDDPTAEITDPGAAATPSDAPSAGAAATGSDAAAGACPAAPTDLPTPASQSYDTPPEMQIDPAKTYVATIATTCGDVVVGLDAAAAPETVNNFVFLAGAGYYDGTPFHRVIDGFMIQGGDPTGSGNGGGGEFPGYNIPDELDLAQSVYDTENGYPQGAIAMANTGQPNSAGSQFFILEGSDPYPLPPQYAIFGQTESGIDVVERIATGEVGGPQGDQALDPVRIVSVTIDERDA